MMYLSTLLVDTGSNPDRPRPGRMWIDNVYNIHRRLSMAFPNYETLIKDPACLMPFDPQNLENRPFLFRLDNNVSSDGQRAVILVQSSIEPNWDWCFANAPDFLAAPPLTKQYDPSFKEGDRIRFRIKLNPTVKSSKHKCISQITGDAGKHGKRLALTWNEAESPESAINAWFSHKADLAGFSVEESHLLQLSWVYGSKLKSQLAQQRRGEVLHHSMRFRSALLEGWLIVKDEQVFLQSLCNGMGSAKSMGFGLLSVIRD